MQDIYIPSQEVQNLLYELCSKRLDTYEVQPPADVVYPFSFIGGQVDVDAQVIKRAVWSRIFTTIHFYDVAERKASLRQLTTLLKHDIRQHTSTPHFHLVVRNLSYNDLTERDSKRDLVHGVLEVELEVS